MIRRLIFGLLASAAMVFPAVGQTIIYPPSSSSGGGCTIGTTSGTCRDGGAAVSAENAAASAAAAAQSTASAAATPSSVTSAVSAEATARAAGDTTNAGAISAEVTRATAAENLKAPIASPTFTGTATAPTFSGNLTGTASGNPILGTTTGTAADGGVVATNSANIATNTSAIALKAPIASPTFTGTVAAPVYSAPAGTATSLSTSYAIASASAGLGASTSPSFFVPVTSTAGLVRGEAVTGTGIPANSFALYVDGGTATVTQADIGGIAYGASSNPYLLVSNSTGILRGMAVFDTTTSAGLNATAAVGGVLGGAAAPTTVVGSLNVNNQTYFVVTSGNGASVPLGSTLFDSTNSSVGRARVAKVEQTISGTFNSYISGNTLYSTSLWVYPGSSISGAGVTTATVTGGSSGAWTLSGSAQTVGSSGSLVAMTSTTPHTIVLGSPITTAIAPTDIVNLYPTVLVSVTGIGTPGVTAGDSLLFSPAVTINQPLTAGLAAGTSVTFTPTSTSLAASGVSTTGTLTAGLGGLNFGLGSANITGGTTYNSVGIGSETFLGQGAGATLPPIDPLTTAVGWGALGSLVTANSESTAFGFGAGRLIVDGNDDTLVGINALGFCTYACNGVIAMGTDAFRNATSLSSTIGIGNAVGVNYAGGDSIFIGNGVAGGSGSNPTGYFNTFTGYSVASSAGLTTASNDAVYGANAGKALTTGSSLALFGYGAGALMTSETNDVAVGQSALATAVSGSNNTAVGGQALANLTNNSDTAVGYLAGHSFTTGGASLVLGSFAGNTNAADTGNYDILISAGGLGLDLPTGSTSDYFAIAAGSTTPFIFTTSTNSNPVTTIQGTTQTPAVISTGTTFTASGCGATTLVGGAAAGAGVLATAGACVLTLTMGSGVAAPAHGWRCTTTDQTTPATRLDQTGYSTTGCTITASASIAANDNFTFSAIGF